MQPISKNITYFEAVKSRVAIAKNIINIPNAAQLENIKMWAAEIFEPTRSGLGNKPLYISSLFRSVELNSTKEVGGSDSSQHCALKGAAGDLDGQVYGNHTNAQIFNYIKDNLEFDQLIWEFGNDTEPDWVHVSFNRGHNRKQILISYKEGKKTKYKNYEN
jgi:zinc D-Ala-D-Ala carboxypeptidase